MRDGAAIRREVERIFTEALKIEVPPEDTDLLESGRLDSLGFVELVFQLESRLGVRIPLDEVEFDDFRSVAAIARLVERHDPEHGRAPGSLPA